MCQINNVLHNTGNKPLTCYKVLCRKPKSIRSPYFSYCSWKLGETKRLEQQSSLCCSRVSRGFFHAFTNKVDAYNEQTEWMDIRHFDEDYIIAKMEIPPYTDYYTGVTEDGIDSIAAPVITFKQIL